MTEGLIIISLIVSIPSIILFFKVWGMCNDVDTIMQKLTEPKANVYHWFDNRTMKVFNHELDLVKEYVYCGRIDEARIILKRLQYHLLMEEQNYTYTGEDLVKFKQQQQTIQQMLDYLPTANN